MGFADAIKTCFRKYVTFSGRASRPEYWYFVLFIFLGSIVLSAVDSALFGIEVVEVAPGQISAESDGPLASIFSLAVFLPALAAAWRRMHDTGRSGLFVLYPLIVMIGVTTFAGFLAGFDAAMSGNLAALFAGAGGLVLAVAVFILILSPLLVLWWLTRPSEPGFNQYGPNPHEVMS